jgi:hypothetical protein
MSSVQSYPYIEATTGEAGLKKGWLIENRRVLVIGIILVVAALSLRLLTFERYLPFLDYTDESVPFLIAQNWRGIDTNPFIRTRYAGYPPAFVTLNIGVQHLVEASVGRPWTVPPDYFYALRLLAAFVGTATALVMASIGWQMAGWLAGLLAGLVWAAAPIIVRHNSLATPDPYVYLMCASAVSLALLAWRKESQIALTGSLIAGILAIYFKLWPVHAVLPFCIVALLLLRRNGRRALRLQALVAIIAAIYLFQIVRPLNMPAREVQTFNREGLAFMLSPDRNLNNWYFAIYPVGMALFFGGIVAALAAYAYSRRRGWRLLDWRQIGLLASYSFIGILMASSFTNVWLGAGKIRHVLPVSVALIPLWAAGIEQVVWTLKQWASEKQRGQQAQRLVVSGALGLVALFLLPIYIPGNIEIIQNFQRNAMTSILWHWSDSNVPNDGLILMLPTSDLQNTWNRAWSGYDGVKPFEWWFEDESKITASSPEAYWERGIRYFVMDEQDLNDHLMSRKAQDFLARLTPIKIFSASPDILGHNVYFYRMLPPQFEADSVFGDQIVLTGYDLNVDEISAGATLHFRPYWQTIRQPDTNYSMFAHLYPADVVEIITQYDGALSTVERPTLTWDDTHELYIGGDVQLAIPEDTPPGDYRLVIGVYDYTSGIRLSSEDGDATSIPITIKP